MTAGGRIGTDRAGGRRPAGPPPSSRRFSNDGALGERVLPSGEELTLWPMLFGNTRLCVGWPDTGTFDRAWCYHDPHAAILALREWDGQGDPPGFFKEAGA